MGNHIFGTFGHDFACGDGKRVMVVGVSPKQWQALVKVTGTEAAIDVLQQELQLDFNKEGDRFQAREQIRELFTPWFATHEFLVVAKALDAEGATWGPYQNIDELVNEDIDCSEDNPLFQTVTQPGIGEYLVPGQPLSFGVTEREVIRPAPLLGQHTDEILSELLGLGDAEIGALHDKGVVAGPQE